MDLAVTAEPTLGVTFPGDEKRVQQELLKQVGSTVHILQSHKYSAFPCSGRPLRGRDLFFVVA